MELDPGQRVYLHNLLLKEHNRLKMTLRLTLHGALDERVRTEVALVEKTLTQLEEE